MLLDGVKNLILGDFDSNLKGMSRLSSSVAPQMNQMRTRFSDMECSDQYDLDNELLSRKNNALSMIPNPNSSKNDLMSMIQNCQYLMNNRMYGDPKRLLSQLTGGFSGNLLNINFGSSNFPELLMGNELFALQNLLGSTGIVDNLKQMDFMLNCLQQYGVNLGSRVDDLNSYMDMMNLNQSGDFDRDSFYSSSGMSDCQRQNMSTTMGHADEIHNGVNDYVSQSSEWVAI